MNSQLLFVFGLFFMTSIAFARPGMLKFADIYAQSHAFFISPPSGTVKDVVNGMEALDRIQNY